MKAIILAAGKATRLLPLTKDTPQCLLKVGGKTILEHQIESLKKAGIEDILVITGYLSDKTEKFCKEKGIEFLFNPFYDVSGMALTLWISKIKLDEDFILLYSDILFDSKIIEGLTDNKADICLAIKKDGLREEAEKVIDIAGIIQNISKVDKGKKNAEFIGISKFSKKGSDKLISLVSSLAKSDINFSLIVALDKLIEQGESVISFDIKDSKFIDIDFPEDLKMAEDFFK